MDQDNKLEFENNNINLEDFIQGKLKDLKAEKLKQKLRDLKSEIKYNYTEAFCLMQYYCNECQAVETLWNSRDGVVPFGINCPNECKCGMQHINWEQDKRIVDFIPPGNMRVFINTTKERYHEFGLKKVELYWNHEEYPMSKMYNSKEEYFEKSLEGFDENEPDIIIGKEFNSK